MNDKDGKSSFHSMEKYCQKKDKVGIAIDGSTQHRNGVFFFTNDTKLIKKSKRIPWLKPKVLTAHEFIEINN